MNIIGKSTINPILFYTGKVSGYLTWMVMTLSLFNYNVFPNCLFVVNKWVFMALLFVGLLFIVFSLVHLGKSTRLGLPTESTEFKTNGLYKISRNPMYVGFNLLTISANLYCPHWVLLLLGIYSIGVYHLIICAEEVFLKNRFGQPYLDYKIKVRRYL